MGVHDLDQKAWKVSLLRSTGLEKLKTNKQLLWWLYHIWMDVYLALVGIYHHWGTSSKRVLAFGKTKLQVVFTIPQIGSKIYSNQGYNISHKNLWLVLAFATHESIQLKMNSKLSCSKLKKYKVVRQAFAKYHRAIENAYVNAYPQCRNSINMWVYVILIKKHEKFLYSDQQGLKKLKTNKQLLWWLHEWIFIWLW